MQNTEQKWMYYTEMQVNGLEALIQFLNSIPPACITQWCSNLKAIQFLI